MLIIKKIHTHLLIIFVAIVLALLLQAGVFIRINEMIEHNIPLEWEQWWSSIVYFVFTIFLIYSTAIFNISLRTIFSSVARFGKLDVVLVFVANVALLFGFSGIYTHLDQALFGRSTPIYWMALKFVFSFLIAVLFAHVLVLIDKIRTAEIDKVRLTEEKAKAELASLREQISPHFLFNTLSSLSSVIRQDDKDKSLEFVDNMSQVYRYILESNEKNLVTVKQELEFLRAYSFLLDKRFGEKFKLKINLPTEWNESKIPPMALQLLVENAIQHNAVSESNPLMVEVFAEDDKIVVRNSIRRDAAHGVSTMGEAGNGFGIGLANLRRRYLLLADQDIIIENEPDVFVVKLPLIKKVKL